MKQLKNFLIKREQSQACLSFAKREKSRLLAKTILTLVALLAVTTGAWAQGYNVTFGGFAESEMNTTVNVASLPQTFTQIGNDAFYPWTVISTSGNMFYGATVTSGGEGKVSVSVPNYDEMSITVSGPFEGTATIHVTGEDDENRDISCDITVSCEAVGGAASAVEVAWNKAAKTGTFTMPGGNVELEPEYFAVAEFTDGGAPTGIADIKATTDDDIVKAGTVKNIGSSTTPQGTVMYYAVQSATAPTAPDYDATGWTDKVPTATDFAEGNVYVWYYIKGAEPASGTDRTDANTCSDSEITALGTTGYVTLLAAPKYNAEFAFDEGTPDAEKAKWGTNIPDGGVVKGTAVTVTYTGSKKVLGVKAEKKAAGKPVATLTAAPTPYGYICVYDEIFETLGTAEGGTLMYKVTTTNVKPTSTEGFSTSNPRGVQNEPSWKNYIWYYIKGDDTHSDSEIFGPIEINVWLM
jgi:hypothetical protein